MEYYDKSKVGKLIAWGGDHFVYDYDGDKVIKFSLIEFMMGKHGQAKLISDYEIAKKFFGKYVLETEIKCSTDGKYLALVQPKITGHFLSKRDLDNNLTKTQFTEIMAAYQALISKGNPMFDLIGSKGAWKGCMSNVFVTPEDQLSIIDATLVEFKGAGIFSPIFFLITAIARWKQGRIITKFMATTINKI